MMAALSAWSDRLLGRGEASITVPVFDGALKSNQLIEDAKVLTDLVAPTDLATDGKSVFVADGSRVWQHDGDSAAWAPSELAVGATAAGQTITALACLPDGGMALALGGKVIQIVGGLQGDRRFDSVAGRPLNAVNALTTANGRLVATDGSLTQPTEHWKHDLMELGKTGRVLAFNLADGRASELAAGLAYAYGACATAEGVWACESWRHRLVQIGAVSDVRRETPSVVVDNLPGYPSRISPAQGGGYWLTCFALRTQLVEFVLREPTFRERMLKEIDPAYWIAPALNSGNTFLEPMQGAHLKMMGVVKPWAPPRSYGLVIRLAEDGGIRYSLHSRFDGQHHGVTAAVECAGYLYLLAKGRNRLLRLSVAELERSLAV